MYYLESLKKELAEVCNKLIGEAVISFDDFIQPPDKNMGDLCLPCFKAAKEAKTSPAALVNVLAKDFSHKKVESVSAAGPYFNLVLTPDFNAEVIKEITEKYESYGQQTWGNKQRVMQEYANGNTHKEIHIGHIRNIAYGDAVNRLLKANGFVSLPVMYINDFGIHVAKTLWHYLKTKPSVPDGHKGEFLGQLYAASVKAIDEGDKEKNKQEVGEVMKSLESREGEIYELWQTTRQWSLEQWQEVVKDFKLDFSDNFYESDFVQEGFKLVDEMLTKGILKKSQGAVIADLEDYKLGVLVVLRSDGTALYPVADLALTIHKVKKHKLDTSLWIVDIRQSQYFFQLFKVLELYGLKAELKHLPYDFVKLPSGMMSSRSGNIISYEDLKKLLTAEARKETSKRHPEWSEEKVNEVVRILVFGALKFEMLKVGGEKGITFDLAKSLRFDGFTAAYLQYTCARINSLWRKGETILKKDLKPDYKSLAKDKEKSLMLAAAIYPEIVKRAGERYEPSEIAKYLYETAQLFNDYYHAVPILNDDEVSEETIVARLDLAKTIALVIQKGLDLLGIETVEEM